MKAAVILIRVVAEAAESLLETLNKRLGHAKAAAE
jgi:hypothetical protein